MKNHKIFTELSTIISDYEEGVVEIVPGLNYRQSKLLKMIEFYSASKYLNGQLDAQGREKPFYQILNGMVIVENAAKDIDTKDIEVTSENGQYDRSFVLSKDIYQWMKANKFGQTLNKMKETHSRYGGLLVKKVIKDGELTLEIPAWKNLVTDQIDIIGGAIVEKHFMLPSDLMKKKGAWENITEALKLAKQSQSINGEDSGSTTTRRIPVYEIRSFFPRSHYKDAIGESTTEDDEDYSYQLYYIAGLQGQKQVLLYAEDDTEEVYKYLARKPKDGRGLGVGVIEEGEEAQVGTNDAVIKQARAFEFASRVIGQSASKKLKGRNLLSEADNGTILEHEDNRPITTVPLVPTGGMAQFDALIGQWFNQYERVTNQYDAQRGEQPPSGTPFRLQAQVLQQSSSVFQDLKEEMELFIDEIFNDWILPHLAKKINREHLLAHEFSVEELKEIDRNFSLNKAFRKAKEQILSGELVTQDEYENYIKTYDDFVKQTKNERFLEIPKDYYKNIESKVRVNSGGESRNKAAILESLNNIMTLYASNPALASDPVLSQLMMKAIEVSGVGISPISIMGAIAEAQKQQEEQAQLQAMQTPQTKPLSLTANPNGQQ